MGRDYIGRIFTICVLGGIGSLSGTFVATVIVGVAESITATFYGPSWSPGHRIRVPLVALVVRPARPVRESLMSNGRFIALACLVGIALVAGSMFGD